MKRVNINIDLDNNEMFEESIRDAVIGQAKQISREVITQLMQAEIERIVQSKVGQLTDTKSYYNPIISKITDLIAERLEKDINYKTETIEQMVETKVAEYLDSKLKSL